MRKCSTALIAFHLQYYFLDYVSVPLLSQSGAVAGDKNTLFHSPVSLDVPFQIAHSRRVEADTETGGTERTHGRESTVLISLMLLYSCTVPLWSFQISM